MLTILAVAVGALGGVLLGFVLVTFAFLAGRSGYTGSEGIAIWDPSLAWVLAASGGLPLGALLTPFVYFRYLARLGPSWKWALLPVATLAGGMVGAFFDLALCGILGAAGFWACAAWIRNSARATRHDSV